MAEGGFDDFEIKDINEEKEVDNEVHNKRKNETSFNNNYDYHNKSINIINKSNPKNKYSRVDYREYIPDVNKMLDR